MSKIIRLIYGVTVVVFLASMFIAIPVTLHSATPPELQVYFLDIGQGDSILIETPEHVSILVDAGSDGRVVQQLGEVLPWWQRKIDYILWTHPDHDHYGGFQSVLQKYQIGQALWNGDEDSSRAFQSLLQEVRQRNIPLRKISQGDVFQWSSGTSLRIVWPPESYLSKDKNNRSITGLLSYGNEDYLLTGDLPQAEEAQMMGQYPSLTAEVLKVGHHGSKGSSGAGFLAALRPQYCIISVGKDNTYGHPNPEAIQRLKDAHCEIHTTADEGRVTVMTDGSTLTYGHEGFVLWKSMEYAILSMF